MPWHFVLVNTDGSAIGELTAAKSRKVIWPLSDAASASFTIDGQHPQALLISELETDLIVYDDAGTKRFRGRLGTSGDQVAASGHQASFSAVDYRGFMGRRILWPGSTTTFTAVDQALIPWVLISDSQGLPGGNLGITEGVGNPTGVIRTFTFAVGSKLSDLFSQVANVTNGFDYEIDPNLALNVFYPQRGSATQSVLEYGGTVLSFARTLDTSKFANAVRYSGESSLTPVTAVASSFSAAGRWESQVGDTSVLDQPTLTLKANQELATDEVPQPSYSMVLRDGWWSPEVLWLGDSAPIVLKSGRMNVISTQRLTQVDLDLGDDGGKTVTLTTGPIFEGDDLALKNALNRLDNLERT